MNRIILSPKALAVAALLIDTDKISPQLLFASDDELAARLELRRDTVYRALRELRDVGALTFSRHRSQDRGRRIDLDASSWVWAAVAATRRVVA